VHCSPRQTSDDGATRPDGASFKDAGEKDAGDALTPSSSDATSAPNATVCGPDAGTVSFTYSDPALPETWSGTNGTFVDACDANGNLTKYSCEVMQVCGPGPNPGCNEFDTGAVKSWSIDCAGHCVAGACPSRCPAFGDILTVESVDAAGNVSLRDAADGRAFTCALTYQQPDAGFDCIANVHVGSRGTFSSQGFSGSYCTGANIGSFGLCYPGGSCYGQDCSYACSVAR
jgi:hypothetical protein